MATLVAPVVDQLSVLLEPELMLVELAVNEVIDGRLDDVTVTVAVAVTDPVELVAFNV